MNFRVPKNRDSNQFTTDDDTESDSSLFPSQSFTRQGNSTFPATNTGARKQDFGGGSFTPYSKKRPPTRDTALIQHTYERIN